MTVIRCPEGTVLALGLIDRTMPGASIARLADEAEPHAPGQRWAVGVLLFPAHRQDDVIEALTSIDDGDEEFEVLVP